MEKLRFNNAYELHEDGSLVSKLRGVKTLKPCDNGIGYRQYYLRSLDGKSKWYKVHRLVAEYYVQNPHNYNEVNHIDGDKSNNHYTNLEWCTHAQNVRHSYDSLGRRTKKGAEHHNYGQKASELTRQLQSERKKGTNHPKFKGFYVFNGVEYSSSTLASESTNLSSRTIIRHAKNGTNGWSFKAI
jgi:hypothetical protein